MATVPATPAVLVTANRAAVYGAVVRWLLHDIRSPTQALSLVAELLADSGEADPDLQPALLESTRQLASQIEMLDRVTRRLPLSVAPGPVVLRDLLTFLAQLYRSSRGTTQLDVAPALSEQLPAVSAVESYLEHALLNLLMNAFEAIDNRDGGRVEVTAAMRAGEVELTIDDNGPGVAAEVRNRLFQPYVTTKPSASRAAGLGLTIARQLVEHSGGTLAYVPKEAPGARFVVRLATWPAARH